MSQGKTAGRRSQILTAGLIGGVAGAALASHGARGRPGWARRGTVELYFPGAH